MTTHRIIELWERIGEDAGDTAWLAAISMVEQACTHAKEGRLDYHPSGRVRRFRRELARAMSLARFAVALQDALNEDREGLDTELRKAAAAEGKRRRRLQTLDAEAARLAKRIGEQAELPIWKTNFHLRPEYPR